MICIYFELNLFNLNKRSHHSEYFYKKTIFSNVFLKLQVQPYCFMESNKVMVFSCILCVYCQKKLGLQYAWCIQ